MPLEPWQAALIGIVALALGWLVYDFLCRSPLAATSRCSRWWALAMSWRRAGCSRSSFRRGALIHTGALMATIMTANVFFIIMPNQRKSIAALQAGQRPDPAWGQSSKIRSTHNNYITLPVLFLMLSNHYPSTFSNPVRSAIVTCIIVAGAMVRLFLQRLASRPRPRAVVGLGGGRIRRPLRVRLRCDRFAGYAFADGIGGPANRNRKA